MNIFEEPIGTVVFPANEPDPREWVVVHTNGHNIVVLFQRKTESIRVYAPDGLQHPAGKSYKVIGFTEAYDNAWSEIASYQLAYYMVSSFERPLIAQRLASYLSGQVEA